MPHPPPPETQPLPSLRIAWLLIILNCLLFVAKLGVGWAFNSLAVLSDAANSFTDIITSVIILMAVRESAKPADGDHPFGHARAEPLAAFTVAVLTCVLGVEVGKEAVIRLWEGIAPLTGWPPVLVLLVVIALKGAIWGVAGRAGRRQGSPALTAAAVDAKMDVVISLLALAGVAGADLGLPALDSGAALLIAVWIGWVGIGLGRENIRQLLGGTPDGATLSAIQETLDRFRRERQILGFHELRVHYVGSEIHLALHLEMDGALTPVRIHAVEEALSAELERIPGVANVAVHVDPTGQ